MAKNPTNPKPPSPSWMIMLANGRVMGPYKTEGILKMIAEGALTGTERIRKSSGGEWISITREGSFYDRLLDALNDAKKTTAPNLAETMSEETVISKLPSEALIPPLDPELQPQPEAEGNFEETQVIDIQRKQRDPGQTSSLPVPQNEGSPPPASSVVDLQNLGAISQAHQARRLRAPLFLFILAIGLFAFTLFWNHQEVDEKVHLLIPKYGSSAKMTGAEIQQNLQRIVFSFQKDTFEGYWDAQERLIALLETAPQSLEARSFLCLTYRELWPYTKQDSTDVDAINSLVKSTKAIDPIGAQGAYCEISKLLVFGKTTDARGILDYLLNQKQFSTDAVLISFKAEVLAAEQDPKSAALFIEAVKEYWPNWVKAALLQAEFLMQSGQMQAAAEGFERVLQMNPHHKVAQILYGTLNYNFFKQTDIALNFLTGALHSHGRLQRQLEAKANFTLAQIWIDKKNPAKAKDYAQRAFDLNPGEAEYKETLFHLGGRTTLSAKTYKHNELVFLGDQYYRAGDCLSAQAEYKAAFEIDASNALAATKAAKCLWQLNQSGEAIVWLSRAMKADPRMAEAYVMQADYYSQRYNYGAALQVLNHAAAKFPGNNEVLRGYGQLEFRRNNMKDAIGYLLRALKSYENDTETLLLLAKSHAALGEFQDAQNYAIRAMELDSTNNEAIVVYAKNLVQFRGLEAGLFYIRDQISKFSYTIEFRIALAEMYKDVERYRDAQTVYEQIIEADPKNKKAYIGLGECYEQQAMFDRAMKAFLNAAVLDPSDAEPLFKAGSLDIDMNRYGEAMKQFQRALKVNGLYPRGNYMAGKAAYFAGDFQTALKFCEEERRINPNLADSYILSAEIYTAMKDFGKCATEYQQAVRLRPQGAEIYVKMARCYRQGGSPDIAESMLNIAATLESGLPDIYKEQGAVYEAKGDNRSAGAAYNKYLTLSPNAPDRIEMEGKVNSLGNQ